MKQWTRGIRRSQSNDGFVMIVLVIIIAAWFSIVAIRGFLSGLNHFNATYTTWRTESLKVEAEGCLDEAWLQINRDASYVGAVLGNCQIAVTPNAGKFDIIVQVSSDDYNYEINSNVSREPFVVNNWE